MHLSLLINAQQQACFEIITFKYAGWVLFIIAHKRGKILTVIKNPENK